MVRTPAQLGGKPVLGTASHAHYPVVRLRIISNISPPANLMNDMNDMNKNNNNNNKREIPSRNKKFQTEWYWPAIMSSSFPMKNTELVT